MKLVTLGDICEFRPGFTFKSSQYRENGLPILGIKNFQNGKVNLNNMNFFDPSDYEKDLDKYTIKSGDIFIAIFGSTARKIGFNNTKTVFFLNQKVNKIEPDEKIVDKRWLFHWLLNNKTISSTVFGVIPNLDIHKLKKLKVYLPDLSEQNRTAKILDKFLELSEELCEELNLRKKHYEYYRDELLSFKQDNKIKWLTLREITNSFYKGRHFSKNTLLNEGNPCIRYTQLYDENTIYFNSCNLFTDSSKTLSPKWCQCGDISITTTSRNWEGIAKACAYLGKEPALIDSECLVIKHKQNPKYLAYVLQTTNFRKNIKLSASSCLLHIVFDSIKSIKIPVPSLKKQEEIVNLLDKFWELSNNIKEGLPAEILLRNQQYEYYRDKLLK